MSSILGAMESNLIADVGPVASRPLDADTMRGEVQLVANELVGLLNDVTKSTPGGAKPDAAVVKELSELLVRVQEFARVLAFDSSPRETQASFLAARRRMWQVEARIARLAWPAGLERRWRSARGRMNAISDEFGLPRVIVSTPAVQASSRPDGAGNRSLVAHLDHAVLWLDEVLDDLPADLRQKPAGARFAKQTSQMRTQLLQLRRRVISNEPADKILQSLTEIERMNHELSDRAANLNREIHPGLAARYRNPADAVAKLRGQITKG